MKFWDASALVPLLLSEPSTPQVRQLAKADPQYAVWWGSPVECLSAITRKQREGRLSGMALSAALDRLSRLRASWIELAPSDSVRSGAEQLLQIYSLRAADSLQLAAALITANGAPSSLGFICLDERLADAARQEGFPVLP